MDYKINIEIWRTALYDGGGGEEAGGRKRFNDFLELKLVFYIYSLTHANRFMAHAEG